MDLLGVNERETFQTGIKGTAEPQLYLLSLLNFKSTIELLGFFKCFLGKKKLNGIYSSMPGVGGRLGRAMKEQQNPPSLPFCKKEPSRKRQGELLRGGGISPAAGSAALPLTCSSCLHPSARCARAAFMAVPVLVARRSQAGLQRIATLSAGFLFVHRERLW